jgi:hypothetical protein
LIKSIPIPDDILSGTHDIELSFNAMTMSSAEEGMVCALCIAPRV